MKAKGIVTYVVILSTALFTALSMAILTAVVCAQPAGEGPGGPEFGLQQGNGPGQGNGPSYSPGQGNGPSRGFGQGSGPGQGCHGQGPGKEKIFERIIQQLGLTAEQQQSIKEHQAAHRTKMKETMKVLKTKKQELRQELEKYEGDGNKINALVSEIKTLVGAQLELRVEDTLAMKEIFTAEQYEQFTQLIKRRAGKKQQGMSGRGRQHRQGFQQQHQRQQMN